MGYQLLQGDCLDILPTLQARSIDAIITDPPYGTTACAWDSVIPLDAMWAELKRVIKPKGAIVLFGAQPFTSALVMSNASWFKYDLVWRKVRVTGHLDAKKKPLREHESILIFCDGQPTYNPQMVRGREHIRGPFANQKNGETTVYGPFKDGPSRQYLSSDFYPRSTIEIQSEMQGLHPTQKPVALMRYLIRTYTNPGDDVLDFTAGSGSTGVAAIEEGRNFIGIEISPGYCSIARKRMEEATAQQPLFMHQEEAQMDRQATLYTE